MRNTSSTANHTSVTPSRVFFITCPLAALLIFTLILPSCKRDNPEMIIRARIGKLAEYVETKNGKNFVNLLTNNFQDHNGRGPREIRGMLAVIFLQNKTINISYNIDRIQVQGESAQADITVKTSNSKLFNLGKATLSIHSQWLAVDGNWLLYRARWERMEDHNGN